MLKPAPPDTLVDPPRTRPDGPEGDQSSGSDSFLQKVANIGEPIGNVSLPNIGDTIGGEDSRRFEIEARIGAGGMGVVFQAKDRLLERNVAIKIICLHSSGSPKAAVDLFLVEARAIAKMGHDNIIRLFDAGTWRNLPYLVIEYLEGSSLQGLLQEEPFPPGRALAVLIQVLNGLEHAHRHGIVHRDLKPSNIFSLRDGRIKLLDFGLAHVVAAMGNVPRFANAGTPSYMAPEQWRGDPQDHRTDLWAVGVMLFEMLSGERPFQANTMEELRGLIVADAAAPSILRASPTLPPMAGDIVKRALQKQPHQRFQTAAEFREELVKFEGLLLREPHRGSRPAASSSTSSRFWSAIPGLNRERVLHHRADRASSPLADCVLLLFVQPTVARADDSSWKAFPRNVLQHVDIDVDVLAICPVWQLVDRPSIEAAEAELRKALSSVSRGSLVLIVTNDLGTLLVRRALRWDMVSRATAKGAGDLKHSMSFRTRRIVEVGRNCTGSIAPEIMKEIQDFGVFYREFEHDLRGSGLPTPSYACIADDGVTPMVGTDEDLAGMLAQALDLEAYATREDQLVSWQTIAHTYEIDRAAHIFNLIDESYAPAVDLGSAVQIVPSLDFAVAGSQKTTHDQVLQILFTKALLPRRVVVSGETGVGKSTVLRMLVRALAIQYLDDCRPTGVLPLLVPLQQEKFTPEEIQSVATAATSAERGRLFFHLLVERWCRRMSAQADRVLKPDSVLARFKTLPAALFLDGVDEFFGNNRGIGPSEFRDLLQFAAGEYTGNPDFSIVLGVRSSQPGVRSFATTTNHVFEILPLSPAQLTERFPATAPLLKLIPDPQVRKLLLTPLVASWIGPRAGRLAQRSLSTPAQVIEQALQAIIEESHLSDVVAHAGRLTDAEQWMDALMLVAWLFFSKFRADISIEEARSEAAVVAESWSAYAAESGSTVAKRLLLGLDLVMDGKTCDQLFGRTIFLPAGPSRFRFIHREWQDFLSSRYLARCIGTANVYELRHVGWGPRLHRTAGELLDGDGVAIEESMVHRVLTLSSRPGAPLIAGNFSALLTNSRVAVSGAAIDLLLTAIGSMSPIARCIALNGLGYRGLRNDDSSARDIRTRLLPVFHSYLSSGNAADALLASIAWCYLQAYAQCFGTRAPPGNWPRPGGTPADRRAVLEMMCSMTDGVPRLHPEHRSVQMAFLQAAYLSIEDAARPISCAHYIYCLCVAWQYGGHAMEVGRELPAILDAGSPVARVFAAYSLVPEVSQLFGICQKLSEDI